LLFGARGGGLVKCFFPFFVNFFSTTLAFLNEASRDDVVGFPSQNFDFGKDLIAENNKLSGQNSKATKSLKKVK